MEKNQEALALAFKKARYKKTRIAELGITPDMTDEAVDVLVEKLALAKAVEANAPITKFHKGQEWYVEHLIIASSMTGTELIEAEYLESVGEVSTESEMAHLLDNM